MHAFGILSSFIFAQRDIKFPCPRCNTVFRNGSYFVHVTVGTLPCILAEPYTTPCCHFGVKVPIVFFLREEARNRIREISSEIDRRDGDASFLLLIRREVVFKNL